MRPGVAPVDSPSRNNGWPLTITNAVAGRVDHVAAGSGGKIVDERGLGSVASASRSITSTSAASPSRSTPRSVRPCARAGSPEIRADRGLDREEIIPLGEESRRVVGAAEAQEVRAAVAAPGHHQRMRHERRGGGPMPRVLGGAASANWASRSSASDTSRKASSSSRPSPSIAASSVTLRPTKRADSAANPLARDQRPEEHERVTTAGDVGAHGVAHGGIAECGAALVVGEHERAPEARHVVEEEGVPECEVRALAVDRVHRVHGQPVRRQLVGELEAALPTVGCARVNGASVLRWIGRPPAALRHRPDKRAIVVVVPVEERRGMNSIAPRPWRPTVSARAISSSAWA